MKAFFPFLLCLAACLIFLPNQTFATTCAIFDFPEAFERSDYVFIGTVTETSGIFNSQAEIKVETAWKPMEANEVWINTKGICDSMNLEKGESYLIYAYQDNGFFQTRINVSNRTAKLANAAEDLKSLKDKPTVHLPEKYLSKNFRIGLTTGFFLLAFLGIGWLLKKILKY